MVIGYVENYIGKDTIVMWFYRKQEVFPPGSNLPETQWVKIFKRRLCPKARQHVLNQILANHSRLVVLGRGT